jgi:hypothetical protein
MVTTKPNARESVRVRVRVRERERERVRVRGNDYEDEQEGELMDETEVDSRHCVDVKQRKRAGGILGVTPREPDAAKDARGEEEEGRVRERSGQGAMLTVLSDTTWLCVDADSNDITPMTWKGRARRMQQGMRREGEP